MSRKKTINADSKAGYFRVSLTLPKNLDDYLEMMGSDIKGSGGFKLAKTEIIRAMIRAMMTMKFDIKQVKSEEDLEGKILASLRKNGKH